MSIDSPTHNPFAGDPAEESNKHPEVEARESEIQRAIDAMTEGEKVNVTEAEPCCYEAEEFPPAHAAPEAVPPHVIEELAKHGFALIDPRELAESIHDGVEIPFDDLPEGEQIALCFETIASCMRGVLRHRHNVEGI